MLERERALRCGAFLCLIRPGYRSDTFSIAGDREGDERRLFPFSNPVGEGCPKGGVRQWLFIPRWRGQGVLAVCPVGAKGRAFFASSVLATARTPSPSQAIEKAKRGSFPSPTLLEKGAECNEAG